MLKDLVKVASRLDSVGLSAEADFIDSVIAKFAHKEEVYGVDTSEEEAFEDGRRSPYKGRDGGHRVGSRENPRLVVDPDQWFEVAYRSANRVPGANKRGRNRMGTPDLSDDANDARSHRRAKYPAYQYNEEGKILFPENTTDLSGEPVTHFRRKEPTVMGRRSAYVPDESTSSYTGDMPEYSGEDLEIERLARRLASLGLTKEANILSSLVKSAGDDDLDREIEEDEDPSNWTDKRWAEYESTAGSNGDGTRDIWEATSEDIAEDGDISDRAEMAGMMAWINASKAGKELEDCQKAYDDAVAAHQEEFGS